MPYPGGLNEMVLPRKNKKLDTTNAEDKSNHFI